MDIKYLYNIIDLYTKNEKNEYKTNLNIKKMEDEIVFSFNMNENNPDKTSFSLPTDIVFNEINNILNIYKKDLLIISEEYNNKENFYYRVLFQNGRILSFEGFTPIEINNIRNTMYNIKINQQEIRLDSLSEERKMAYNPNYLLQQAGFASYTTLFLVALYLTDAFLIALWIFKAMTK